MIDLSKIEGFEWDEGNIEKNWVKHRVSVKECEQIFFDRNKKIMKDVLHSNKEERFILLGKTIYNRLIYVVFTARHNKIRVISARDISQAKEIKLYEERN